MTRIQPWKLKLEKGGTRKAVVSQVTQVSDDNKMGGWVMMMMLMMMMIMQGHLTQSMLTLAH